MENVVELPDSFDSKGLKMKKTLERSLRIVWHSEGILGTRGFCMNPPLAMTNKRESFADLTGVKMPSIFATIANISNAHLKWKILHNTNATVFATS